MKREGKRNRVSGVETGIVRERERERNETRETLPLCLSFDGNYSRRESRGKNRFSERCILPIRYYADRAYPSKAPKCEHICFLKNSGSFRKERWMDL